MTQVPQPPVTVDQLLQEAGQYFARGALREAEELCRRAVSADPRSAPAHNALATVLRQAGAAEVAIFHFRQAAALAPDVAELHNSLGALLQTLGRIDDALPSLRQAVALDPQHLFARINLGTALQTLGQLDAAMDEYRQALALAPGEPMIQFNMGFIELLRGRSLRDGIRKLESFRQVRRSNPFIRGKPAWDGSDLAGRRILLFAEQGRGDTIQFVRFVPQVQQRGGKVILTCQPELTRLLHDSFPDVQVLTHDEQAPPPPFDVHAPILALPALLDMKIEDVGQSVPYLKSRPDLSARWRERLGSTPGLTVGLNWAANPAFPNDRYRSATLEAFAPLAESSKVRFISLQKVKDGRSARDTDFQSVHSAQHGLKARVTGGPSSSLPLIDWTDELSDFADTAALIDCLDLVMTVDTAVAHLAGAMGKPVWVLLGFVPDWRWLLNRSDTPWYPTMRLFRQPEMGDWATPINAVVQSLKSFKPPGNAS